MTQPCHPAPPAEAPPVEWLPLWQLDDPAVPPLPSPEQVRARKREERERRLLLRLLERHAETLGPALLALLWPLLVPRLRQLLAADLPGALRALGLQPEATR